MRKLELKKGRYRCIEAVSPNNIGDVHSQRPSKISEIKIKCMVANNFEM